VGALVSCSATGSDADSVAWRSTAVFSELTYWNHSSGAPAASDAQQRCLDWLRLAQRVRRLLNPEPGAGHGSGGCGEWLCPFIWLGDPAFALACQTGDPPSFHCIVMLWQLG
jgi:hypothetical protein